MWLISMQELSRTNHSRGVEENFLSLARSSIEAIQSVHFPQRYFAGIRSTNQMRANLPQAFSDHALQCQSSIYAAVSSHGEKFFHYRGCAYLLLTNYKASLTVRVLTRSSGPVDHPLSPRSNGSFFHARSRQRLPVPACLVYSCPKCTGCEIKMHEARPQYQRSRCTAHICTVFSPT